MEKTVLEFIVTPSSLDELYKVTLPPRVMEKAGIVMGDKVMISHGKDGEIIIQKL